MTRLIWFAAVLSLAFAAPVWADHHEGEAACAKMCVEVEKKCLEACDLSDDQDDCREECRETSEECSDRCD